MARAPSTSWNTNDEKYQMWKGTGMRQKSNAEEIKIYDDDSGVVWLKENLI